MDNYATTLLKQLQAASTDDEVLDLIDRIYNDGFADALTEHECE